VKLRVQLLLLLSAPLQQHLSVQVLGVLDALHLPRQLDLLGVLEQGVGADAAHKLGELLLLGLRPAAATTSAPPAATPALRRL